MQPKSPNPDFDFMLKDKPKAGRRLPQPNLPKPVKIGAAAIAAIFLIIIISSLLSGRSSGSTQAFEGTLARGQEIVRVTSLVQQQLTLQDPQTQVLAATVNSAISSDNQEITSYLAKNNVKVSPSQLALDTDKSTDTSLRTAAQNNSLDPAYVSYLKGALNQYATDLQNAYNLTGPNGKTLLGKSLQSTRTLLNTPPIKT